MLEPTLASMIPDTDYFEIDSERVGTRFAVWVTRPPNYSESRDCEYEVLYITDGNASVGPLAPTLPLSHDPIWPVRPFLQVVVGYVGDEARNAGRVRIVPEHTHFTGMAMSHLLFLRACYAVSSP